MSRVNSSENTEATRCSGEHGASDRSVSSVLLRVLGTNLSRALRAARTAFTRSSGMLAGSSSLNSPQAILPALIVIWYCTRYCVAVAAFTEVEFEVLAALDGEIAADVFEEEFRELPALHERAPPKCGASMVRNAWRARCSRIFVALTDNPSILAVSSVSRPFDVAQHENGTVAVGQRVNLLAHQLAILRPLQRLVDRFLPALEPLLEMSILLETPAGACRSAVRACACACATSSARRSRQSGAARSKASRCLQTDRGCERHSGKRPAPRRARLLRCRQCGVPPRGDGRRTGAPPARTPLRHPRGAER